MKITKWGYIVLFLFLILNTKAQNFEIGYELGFGKTGWYYSYSKLKAITFLDDSGPKSFRTGFLAYFSPDSLFISIKSGLIYIQMISNDLNNLKIIQLPIGADIQLGKKKHFIIGGGLYFNYLMSNKITDITFQNNQIGLYANIGLLFPINTKMSIDFKVLYGYDLTKIYTEESYSPIGGLFSTDTYSTNLNIVITLRYKLITGTNNKYK